MTTATPAALFTCRRTNRYSDVLPDATNASSAVNEFTCPSGNCSSGNLLIGIVQRDGSVLGVHPPLEVDEVFVARAEASSTHAPETRFRFAGACVTTACKQWTGHRCAISDAATTKAPALDRLQPCAVRPTCRWWAQNGSAVCASCPLVVHTPRQVDMTHQVKR